jgi:hypothetical protein
MIETSFAGKEPPLLSPRTADYIAALIQEGENFDYSKWLQRVRGEEASTKCIPSKLVDPEMDNQAGASACNSTWPHSLLLTRAAPIPKTLRPPHRASKYQTAENRLRRRLEELRHAWDVFQASRARDAVYGYLEAVFAIVKHFKVRRKTKKLLRHAFKFAELPFDRNADPFTAVIRCACDDNVDIKTISKWARALRYVAQSKVSPTQLKTFMKETGGVNACADRYAKYLRRSRR